MSPVVKTVLWVLGVIGALVLVAAFVLFGPPHLAETFAEPEFCGSCHEMQPWVESFDESDHSELESCNDCHLPHDSTVSYYFWEGVVGVRDLVKHTVGAVPETIEARERSKDWILENCHRCHDDDIEDDHGEERDLCWSCHDDVFHDVDQGQ
jgi:cytochrome c nitrite reductase small subunit